MKNLWQSGYEFTKCLLKDGSIAEREVRFYADGSCVTWWEERHPDGLGYYEQCSECEMDENPENWEWETDSDDVVKPLEAPASITFDTMELAYDPREYYED